MALRMDLWQVEGSRLVEIPTSSLDVEERLEDWFANDPAILRMEVRRVEKVFPEVERAKL
jgi:hypothetical protein